MIKWIQLKYCPRTKPESPSPLKKPIKHCAWSSNINNKHYIDAEQFECRYWTTKGLIKYLEYNNIKIEIGIKCWCVLKKEE